MPARLVALDEGPDINLDRAMVVVGRHPSCDTRLDSLRVSRHHCCMTQENGEVMVRDLGSTNGIRINGQRVEIGRIRPGDELSIAHIRYRLENGQGHEQTIAEPTAACWCRGPRHRTSDEPDGAAPPIESQPGRWMPLRSAAGGENAFAAAVRKLLPNGVADKCRIQVIVQMAGDPGASRGRAEFPWGEPCLGERRRMSFRLIPLVKGTAPLIALYRPVLLIGRHLECDVRIDSPKVSRRHCCLAMAYDRVLIRDLGSRNGVRVNGRLVDESRLHAGDELAIGPILFRLEEEVEEPPAGAPRPVGTRPSALRPRNLPAGEPWQAPRDRRAISHRTRISTWSPSTTFDRSRAAADSTISTDSRR